MYVAEIVTFVFALTADVVTVNGCDTVLLADIDTEAGTVTLALLLLSATTALLAGAGPSNATVAVVFEPPVTKFGESDTEASDAGLTVKVAVLVVPL